MDAHIADLQLQLEHLQSTKNDCELDIQVMAHHMSRLIAGPAPWGNPYFSHSIFIVIIKII
jgi:hypothetical protein